MQWTHGTGLMCTHLQYSCSAAAAAARVGEGREEGGSSKSTRASEVVDCVSGAGNVSCAATSPGSCNQPQVLYGKLTLLVDRIAKDVEGSAGSWGLQKVARSDAMPPRHLGSRLRFGAIPGWPLPCV